MLLPTVKSSVEAIFSIQVSEWSGGEAWDCTSKHLQISLYTKCLTAEEYLNAVTSRTYIRKYIYVK